MYRCCIDDGGIRTRESNQWVKYQRPFALLLAKTFLPFLDFNLAKNPNVLFLFKVEGWYVLPLDLNLFCIRLVMKRKADTGWLSWETIGLEIAELKPPNEEVIAVLLKSENWRNCTTLADTYRPRTRERENI